MFPDDTLANGIDMSGGNFNDDAERRSYPCSHRVDL